MQRESSPSSSDESCEKPSRENQGRDQGQMAKGSGSPDAPPPSDSGNESDHSSSELISNNNPSDLNYPKDESDLNFLDHSRKMSSSPTE